MNSLSQRFDDFVARYPRGTLVFLLIFYSVSRAPLSFIVTAVDWPFDALYMAKHLLFSPTGLNSELSKTLIVSANNIFIYPAGYFMLVRLLGNIQNMQIFFFMIQALVPLLLFKIFRSLMSAGTALLLALFLGHYGTSPTGWSPDHIIHPLLLLVLVLLSFHKTDQAKLSLLRIAIGGFLIGVATVIKHPIGIFFVLAVFALLFFRSVCFAGEPKSGHNRFFLFFFLTGLLGSGIVILTRSVHLESAIYFLVPYFSFWMLVGYFFIRNKAIGFDLSSYWRDASVLAVSFLILPGLMFFLMGQTVGFSRYGHSLFGMNFNSLARYDRGISMFLQEHFASANLDSLRGVYSIYMGFLIVAMVLFPLLTNSANVINMFKQLKARHINDQRLRRFLELASLGMIGAFMMFPLDGYPILATKLFLFCPIFLYSYRRSHSASLHRLLKIILVAAAIPVLVLGFSKPLFLLNTETTIGSKLVHDVVGLRLEKDLANELKEQIDVLEHSIKTHDYFAVNEHQELTPLMAFVDNPRPQYYRILAVNEMNNEVTEQIVEILREVHFIIVNTSDLEKYSHRHMTNPYLSRIFDYVIQNYIEVDRYAGHLPGFIIMKNVVI